MTAKMLKESLALLTEKSSQASKKNAAVFYAYESWKPILLCIWADIVRLALPIGVGEQF